MRIKKTPLAFAACCLLLTTGCWDRVEIDQRGFVVGIAIDHADGSKKYKGTYQFVVPAGLKQSGGGDQKASTQAFYNLTTVESSMPALAARLSGQTSRSPYFEHLRLIVISREVASNDTELADVLDFFLRNNEMRRGIMVLIAENQAIDVLNIKPVIEKMPVQYIESIAKNTQKTNFLLPEVRIGQVHENLIRHESFVIQKAKVDGKEISLQGGALFDGITNQLLGFLSGEEVQGLNMVTGKLKGGIIEGKVDKTRIDFNVERLKRSIQVEPMSSHTFKFLISIETEGTIDKSTGTSNLSDSAALREMEAAIEDVLVKTSQKLINKLQNVYKKDVMQLGSYLYQNHYRMWKPVQDNWDQGNNYFSQSVVEVKARAIVRRIGNINESRSKR